MSAATERITGFACEVNEDKWRELVKVADEVGCPVDRISRKDGTMKGRYKEAGYDEHHKELMTDTGFKNLIPYPDFLAKLKGVEKWEPKNGDEVEVVTCGGVMTGRYMGLFGGDHWVFYDDAPYPYSEVRPLRPTITRKEAEEKLKELGVNARIID